MNKLQFEKERENSNLASVIVIQGNYEEHVKINIKS